MEVNDGQGVSRYRFRSPKYLPCKDRLNTYQRWPKQMSQDKYSLAAAGLFYIGEGDICECFSCGVRISQWELFDNVLSEHYRWSKDCLFLKMIGYCQARSDECQRPIEAVFTQQNKQHVQGLDFTR